MQLPIRVEVQYGKTSTSESSREVLEPTADELSELLREMSRLTAIIDVCRLDTDEVLQVSPIKDSSVPKLQWELGRFDDAVRTRYEIACNSQDLAVQLIAEWVTSKNTRGQFIGGYEWSPTVFPDVGENEEDAIFFDFKSEVLVPVDREPVKIPTFIDQNVLHPLVKHALIDAWKSLLALGGIENVYAFGLDRLGEGFLVIVGYRRVNGVVSEIDELYVDIVGANELISEANQSIEDWENETEIDSMPVYEQTVKTTFEVGIASLQELRLSGTFSDAPNVILNVWHREAKPTDLDTVTRCNPPEIAALAEYNNLGSFL